MTSKEFRELEYEARDITNNLYYFIFNLKYSYISTIAIVSSSQ